MTAEAVCHAAEISNGALSRFENGLSRPRKATVRALAAVYDVTPQELRRAWHQTRAAAAQQLAELKRDRRHTTPRTPAPTTTGQLMSIAEVSAFAGVSVDQVALWAQQGKLSRLERPSGRHLYRKAELRFLADLENGDGDELLPSGVPAASGGA